MSNTYERTVDRCLAMLQIWPDSDHWKQRLAEAQAALDAHYTRTSPEVEYPDLRSELL